MTFIPFFSSLQPSYIPLIALFFQIHDLSLLNVLVLIYEYIYIYIYILKYSLLSLNNVTYMFIFRDGHLVLDYQLVYFSLGTISSPVP